MKQVQTLIAAGIVTTIFFTQLSLPAFAVDFGGNGLLKDVHQWINQASRTAEQSQNELQRIIHQADNMINMRLTSLNNLISRVQNDSRLTAGEKSSLISNIQTDINGLTTLKAKIDADTTVSAAGNDIKQIVSGYYIYARFEPKVRLLIMLNNLQTVTANIQALVPQIQNLINTFQSQGKDISQIQPLLNDISSQLQTINTTLSNDITTVQNVSATSTDPQSAFKQVRLDITQIVQSGFAKIKSDFAQIRKLFYQLIFNNPTGSTGSPTTTPISVTPTQILTPASSPAPSL